MLALGVVGLALSGCGVDWRAARLDTEPSPTPPALTPDLLARFAAVDALSQLRLQAEALGTADGDVVAAAHAAHLTALGDLPGPVPSGSVTPSGWPTAPPASAPAVDTRALAEAEQAAGVAMWPAPDLSAETARLLTSIVTSLFAAARLLDPTLPEPMLTSAGEPAPTEPAPTETATPTAPTTTTQTADDPDTPSPTRVPVVPATLTGIDAEAAAQPLQAVVDAEDAAGFAYASFAAALAGDERERAVTLMSSHRDRTLQVRALAASAGVTLTAQPAAYAVPRLASEADVLAACAEAERSCAVAAAGLFDLAGDGVRPLSQALLLAAGQAQASWGPLPALPGLE